jgi:hypothetical protein
MAASTSNIALRYLRQYGGPVKSADGLAGAVVVPDRGGQGECALGDADGDALEAVRAMLFKVELALEGVVDRLDELAHRLEYRLAEACATVGQPWNCQWS